MFTYAKTIDSVYHILHRKLAFYSFLYLIFSAIMFLLFNRFFCLLVLFCYYFVTKKKKKLPPVSSHFIEITTTSVVIQLTNSHIGNGLQDIPVFSWRASAFFYGTGVLLTWLSFLVAIISFAVPTAKRTLRYLMIISCM